MFVVVVAIGGVMFACSTSSQEARKESAATWPQQMQSMSEALKRAVPYVYSRVEFRKDANRDEVLKSIQQFRQAAHKLPQEEGQKMIGRDPLIAYSARNLQEDLAMAEQSFVSGQFDFSQHTMKSAVTTCFGCHSSRDYGPQFVQFETVPSGFQLTGSEKAEVYVATRQYDKALEILESELREPYNYYEYPFEQERALRKFLVLAVRIKKDPARAKKVLESFLTKNSVPVYLREYVDHWLTALNEWAKIEKLPVNRRVDSLRRSIVKKADAFGREAANIETLRLTSLLHENLLSLKPGVEMARTYKDLGDAYDSMADMGFWNLPEIYYEACIRENPKSKLAKDCFGDLERVTIIQYSGTAGLFLPEDERARMKELKVLSGL
jgi:tetratricopeptide (TPR) repeat protein